MHMFTNRVTKYPPKKDEKFVCRSRLLYVTHYAIEKPDVDECVRDEMHIQQNGIISLDL